MSIGPVFDANFTAITLPHDPLTQIQPHARARRLAADVRLEQAFTYGPRHTVSGISHPQLNPIPNRRPLNRHDTALTACFHCIQDQRVNDDT